MGLLDKILKTIKSEVTDYVKNQINNQNAPQTQTPRQNKTCCSCSKSSCGGYQDNPATNDEYFAGLITESNFEGYEIERNVSLSRFDSSAHASCFPVSYLFKKNGENALAVFVMNDSQYRSMSARGSYEILENNNIPYIRFFKGWQNEENYVLNRIKDNL